MTQDERSERSRRRAEEYSLKKRTRFLLMLVALALYVVVPVLWGLAVEYGFVHAIRSQDLVRNLDIARSVSLIVFCFLAMDFLKPRSRKDDKPKTDVPPPAA